MTRPRHPSIAIAALLLLPAWAAAADITGVSARINNTPDWSYSDSGQLAIEFRSLSTLGSVQPIGSGTGFVHRMAWFAGNWADLFNAGFITNEYSFNLGWEVSFTVLDPGNAGYRLRLDTELRGALAARRLSGNAAADVSMPALEAQLDAGQGFVPVSQLDTTRARLTSSSATAGGHLISEYPSHGYDFAGTRTFTLRFTTPGDDLTLRNEAIGPISTEVFARFGLGPTLDELAGGAYPGPDGEAPSQHGHFLRVWVDTPPPPVPEPAAWAMLTAGLGLLLWRRRAAALRSGA